MKYNILKEYFNNPITGTTSNVKLDIKKGLSSVKAEPFMDVYKIRTNKFGGVVYSGNIPIATIGPLIDLYVDPAFRGKGIAINLIVAWYRDNTDFFPTFTPIRNIFGKRAYISAWEILEVEIKTQYKITN